MYLYLIWGILALFSITEIAKLKIKNCLKLYNWIYGVVLVCVFLLSMLRWENGTDWEPYYDYFNLVTIDPDYGYMEPGFTWLCYFNSQYMNYTWHLGVMALLCILPIAKRVKEFSPFPLFSLLIWFTVSFAHMFPVRQTIAISLFVFSWKYIQERRLIPFLCMIALAATFHLTVLIVIPIYFLWNKHIPAKFFILAIIAVFIVSVASSQTFANLLSFVGGNSLFEEKLDNYMDNGEETFGSAYSPLQVLFRGCVNRSFYFFIPLFFLNKCRKGNVVMNGMFNMYFYSFLLFLMVTPISVALGRLCVYTDMSQLLLLPYIFTLKINRKSALLMMCIILIYLCIRFRGVVFNYEDLYIPYHCVLFN